MMRFLMALVVGMIVAALVSWVVGSIATEMVGFIVGSLTGCWTVAVLLTPGRDVWR